MKYVKFILLSFVCYACSEASSSSISGDQALAEVISVDVSGEEFGYSFAVGIASPDKGCEQYADWWEVLSLDGKMIYRRILQHSHIDEQPFVRSGGSINIPVDQEVIVRVHMNNSGYSSYAMKGSVKDGFDIHSLERNTFSELAKQEPQPQGCAF